MEGKGFCGFGRIKKGVYKGTGSQKARGKKKKKH